MKYDNDLKEIIDKQGFKQFFQLLDYLLIAGYSEIDAFAISLKHFPAHKIWENVAFVRYSEEQRSSNNIVNEYNPEYDYEPFGEAIHRLSTSSITITSKKIIIGLLDDDNIHLSNLFDVYRKSICDESMFDTLNIYESIESYCKTILKFKLPCDILTTLLCNSFKKHFGYELKLEYQPF